MAVRLLAHWLPGGKPAILLALTSLWLTSRMDQAYVNVLERGLMNRAFVLETSDVQDSTTMAIRLETRYRGLRSPHKMKAAVSGCSRECAEAQVKDFGVIATEKGWNLYIAGNGGQRPRIAQLFASDLDDEKLIRYIDRYLVCQPVRS